MQMQRVFNFIGQWPLTILWILFYMQPFSYGQVTADSDFYTAGVVEFRPIISGMSSADMLADHLQAYLSIIESPEAQNTDIIVFPEGTLNNVFQLTYVPSENDRVIPCLFNETSTPYSDFLITLSCAARSVRKYLVINLTEKEDCAMVPFDTRPCALNGLNIYNTNVVFDREGRVVSRYRKVNIYVENKNTTQQPEYAIFDTDFGVRFGHFICFDILFYTPAQELVDRFKVRDFIFTSLFYSELPFLTATQLQQGWAWGNNVNLLAAGASYPESGITGTGIYAGQQGPLTTVMVKDKIGERKLYIARVPKTQSPRKNSQFQQNEYEITKNRNLHGLTLMKDPQIENYNSILLDFTNSMNIEEKLCQGDWCCSFNINGEILANNSNPNLFYKYRLGVFDGRRSYQKEQYSDIKVCAIYTCAGDDVMSCGIAKEDLRPSVLFRKIQIQGYFPKNPQILINPSTIDDALDPLTKDYIEWIKTDQGSFYNVEINLAKEHNALMTFGIYGHYYEKSGASLVAVGQCLGITLVSYVILKAFHKFIMILI
ncbi:vanin-like protein 1 [Haematobia irritans]|uniref:vanin-like protein 1 n=1 Tax=Haematobia irritans TaxID=7368 RepID=UPI003F509305